MMKISERPVTNSSVKETFCNDSEQTMKVDDKDFVEGFVFLDQASRMPLEHPLKSRSRRSVITLKNIDASRNDVSTDRSGLLLGLPFRKENSMDSADDVDSVSRNESDESPLAPRLSYRALIQDTDLYHPCVKRHYNETNQEEALEHYFASGKKKITSLHDHMDPEERKHLPIWEGVPNSPSQLPPLPLSPTGDDKVEKKMKGKRSPNCSNLSPSSPFSESKTAADGRNSLRGSITKPGEKHRVNPRARAA